MKSAVSLVCSAALAFILLGFTSILSAQPVTLSVTDQHGTPLPDVVITLDQSTADKPSATHIMDQINQSFVPHVLVIRKGDEVQFPNSDNIRHHVYSFSEAKPFELKLYSGKPEAPVNFERAGLVVLGCNIHDSMLGYIYVTDSAVTGVTDSNGRLTLNLDADTELLTLWHERYSPQQSKVMTLSVKTLAANGWQVKMPLEIDLKPDLPQQEHTGFGNSMRH